MEPRLSGIWPQTSLVTGLTKLSVRFLDIILIPINLNLNLNTASVSFMKCTTVILVIP